MGIFFAASVHPKVDFLLGAFVYCPGDLNKRVGGALRRGGWRPGEDQIRAGFMRGLNVATSPIRNELHRVLRSECRVGIMLIPADNLLSLGAEAFRALSFFLQKHSFPEERHEVFFDRGIFAHAEGAGKLMRTFAPLPSCNFHFEQNAKRILSLQLAALAAQTCAAALAEPFPTEAREYLFSDLYVSPDCSDLLRMLAEKSFGRGAFETLH